MWFIYTKIFRPKHETMEHKCEVLSELYRTWHCLYNVMSVSVTPECCQ